MTVRTTARSTARNAARVLAVAGLTAGFVLPLSLPASADVPPPVTFHSDGNPILGDGSYYSADAAPLVVGDKLYIYSGHDEAAPQEAGFAMHDYGVFSTDDVASGNWSLSKDNLDPDQVFSWASGNNAYAGQVFPGADGRYYWYLPVQSKDTTAPNAMAIGVAVSDSPLGPWTDAIGKPLLTWTDVFGTSTQGQELIDPAIFRDDDGTVYLYWGSWGVSRVVKLTPSMTQIDGGITTLSGLDSFYEAPWVFKRNGIYYMAYDWKQGGSACTPSNYQACIGYATASSPLGPWTYRGLILGGTSATTMHPSIVQYHDKWYITYHTKDAVGGGHFRRSVAIDEVTWDGDTIKPVTQTRADDPKYRLGRNVAPDATVSASFTEQPPMRVGALNDGRALTAMLPPDEWGNYRGSTSANESDWVSYQWDAPVRVDGTGIQFQEDPNWIRPPASWQIEYLSASGDWQPVSGARYPTAAGQWHDISFDPVTTTALRATFKGRPEGAYYHSVAVSEWEVYAAAPAAPAPVAVSTTPGTAPALPEAVRLTYPSGPSTWAPVNWHPVAAEKYAQAGSFTVSGRVLGYADEMLTATVTVDPNAIPPVVTDTTAPTASISFSGRQGKDGWYSSPVTARVSADDDIDYRTSISARVGTGAWVATPAARHADVQVSAQGSTDVSGKAADAAGNTSAEVTRTVKIDTVAPEASAAVDSQTRATTITAADALSGLDTIEYRFDSAGAWQSYAGSPVAAPDALPHTLYYRALDVAGNTFTGTASVPLGAGGELTGNVASYATASASYTSAWEQVKGLTDGTAGLFETAAGKLGAQWGTWPQVGEQTARLDWPFDVTVDRIGVWWFQDANDSDNGGMIAPREWKLQYLAADGATWQDVTPTAGTSYARTRDAFVPVSFDQVTTRSLRIVAQSWGTASGGGSVGIREWQVVAAGSQAPDITAPTVAAMADPADPNGTGGWYTGPVTVTAKVTDDRDPAPIVEAAVDGAPYATVSGPIVITGDGSHALTLRATDAAGNVSAEAAWTGRIDATAPVSKAVWASAPRTLTLAAADNTSSVSAVEYAIGDGSWQAYTAPIAIGADATTVRYRATDAAGNVESTRSIDVPKAGVALTKSSTSAVLSASTVLSGSAATVAISVTGSGTFKPTGAVRITEWDTEIATGRLAAGKLTLSTPTTLLPGTHRLVVQYAGDDTYAASSSVVILKVVRVSSTTTVQTAATVGYGAEQTVTVTVASGAGITATGQVTIKVDGQTAATGLLSAGVAQVSLPRQRTGQHEISAVYGGDFRLATSTGTATTTVTKAPSATQVTFDPAQITSAAKGKATVQVSVTPSTVAATGLVSATVTGEGVNAVVRGRLQDGMATLVLPKLAAGTYQVVTSYSGTSNIDGSTVTGELTVTAG